MTYHELCQILVLMDRIFLAIAGLELLTVMMILWLESRDALQNLSPAFKRSIERFADLVRNAIFLRKPASDHDPSSRIPRSKRQL